MDLGDLKNMDPNILYSIINMKLRDFYSNIENLCSDMNLNENELIAILKNAGYVYNRKNNCFE